jgi:hypothetical protein
LVQIKGYEEKSTLKEGEGAGLLKWVNDRGKRCQVVEDVNLQLGSEEWLIRRHL